MYALRLFWVANDFLNPELEPRQYLWALVSLSVIEMEDMVLLVCKVF